MQRKWPVISTLAVALVSLAGGGRPATAQGWPPDAPTFATLDRQDGTSFIGGQLGLTFFDDDLLAGTSLTGVRFDLYGQYVSASRLGFYGNVPLSHVIIEDFDDETAIGNVEGGVIYILRTGPGTEFVLHGGLTLPTADDEEPDAELGGFFTNAISTWPRLTDFAHVWPKTVWTRLGVSPILQSGLLVVRADLGVDIALNSDEDFGEPDPLIRVNVGGGLDTGTFAVLGELVSIINTEDDTADEDENALHTLALSARFRGQTLEPGIAFGIPLDESVRDFIDFFLIAGLQGRL